MVRARDVTRNWHLRATVSFMKMQTLSLTHLSIRQVIERVSDEDHRRRRCEVALIRRNADGD